MNYSTIECIDEKIDNLTLLIRQMVDDECFILTGKDIAAIKRGREEYEIGKTISGVQLKILILENVK